MRKIFLILSLLLLFIAFVLSATFFYITEPYVDKLGGVYVNAPLPKTAKMMKYQAIMKERGLTESELIAYKKILSNREVEIRHVPRLEDLMIKNGIKTSKK